MKQRHKTGISVLVYQPFTFPTNESEWVKAAYRLAALPLGDKTYLIDEYGVGVGPIEDPSVVYQQPVYKVESGDHPIDFRAPIVGCVPINKETLDGLHYNKSLDLADFILPGEDCSLRLERWAQFWESERVR